MAWILLSGFEGQSGPVTGKISQYCEACAGILDQAATRSGEISIQEPAFTMPLLPAYLLSIALLLAGCGGSSPSPETPGANDDSIAEQAPPDQPETEAPVVGDDSGADPVSPQPPTNDEGAGDPEPPAPPVEEDPADPPPPEPPGDDSISVGLQVRPSNLTCVAPPRGAGAVGDVTLVPAFEGLPGSLSRPVGLLQSPENTSRWYVVEQGGRIRVINDAAGGAAYGQDFINVAQVRSGFVSNGEAGLLGMAFHPDFATNRWVYLSWTEGSPMQSVVARFTADRTGELLFPTSLVEVLRVNQDFGNHNGGHLEFGPDGFLYIGLGDGGSGGDPNNRAQDTTNLLGAMLRIDVDNGSPYAIPPGNPFAGNAFCAADHSSVNSCPEIFAWGLRNPWRWSFDKPTGRLFAADVGQNVQEEIDIVSAGNNYGWDCREGDQAYSLSEQSPICSTNPGVTEPIHTYGRSLGVSVTGGHVYRGSAISAFIGDYLFGDFVSGRIWRLREDDSGQWSGTEVLDTSLSISSFALDAQGELLVIDYQGAIWRLVPSDATGGSAVSTVAPRLSETGCFDPAEPSRPAGGMLPYSVAAPFWSDGADKDRWFAIPDGTVLSVSGDGRFWFPPGAVLAKHFRLGGRLIETRLFMHHPDGEWVGYSYEWLGNQQDAVLVPASKLVDIGGADWLYPDNNQCLGCHTAAAGFALGPEVAQLNFPIQYPQTGTTANQLATLQGIGVLSGAPLVPADLPTLASPDDASQPLADRARAYLHTNCAQCHRPGGPTPSFIDLRIDTLLRDTGICGQVPQEGSLGIENARIIAPGAPDRSVLLARMNRRDQAGAMPPLSRQVDADGVALITDWIASLAGCDN